MFDKVKQIYQLQKQAKAIKEELANIHIEAEEKVRGDEGVVVTVNGEMHVVKVVISPGLIVVEHAKQLEEAIAKATNKAIKKAQEIAAEKMKGMMGDMQGLMGGMGQ
jgi:DNA-binding protein YbaB